MKALRNLMLVAVVVGTMTVMGARSFAGPLPSFPSVWTPGQAVGGESHLASVNTAGNFVSVDWWVIEGTPFGTPGVFWYFYQLENTANREIEHFTVSFRTHPLTTVGQILYNGTFEAPVAGDPTGSTNFPPTGLPHVLAGEAPELTTYVVAYATSITVTPTDVTFSSIAPNNPGLPAGKQNKVVFIIIDHRPPKYGYGTASNSIPPSPWVSGVTGVPEQFGDPIPVPSPEPTLALLLATGLVGIGFLRRKRK
jgi:hypothetical protein